MKQIQKGFTLIELMIVVAIVGILAAIALPAYQDFIVRSKMSESMAAIAACKTSVAEYTSAHGGTLPTLTTDAGCSTTPTQYVASLTALAGVITTVSAGTGATPLECTLTLTPVQSGVDITSWTPGYTGCASKFVPSSFRP
jgi:type IV pilus assembly protein PilA